MIDMEDAVVGAMILSPDLIGACRLSEQHFRDPVCGTICKTLHSMDSQSLEIDAVTIAEELNSINPDKNWAHKIATKTDVTPSVDLDSFQSYQDSVIKKHKKREARKKMETMEWERMSYDEINNRISEANEIMAIEDNQAEDLVSQDDIADMDDYFESRTVKGFQKGIMTTGFGHLDDAIMGIRRTDLVIISGESGKGKTTTALNLADHIASEGGAVEIYSLEMPHKLLRRRLIAREAGVSLKKIFKGGLSDDEVEKCKHATRKLKDKDISIVTDEETIRDITASARASIADDGLDMIVIDYLQELSNHLEPSASRNEYYEDAVKRMKRFSIKNEVPILLISSLNKDGTAYYTSQSEYKCDSHLRLFDPNDGDDPIGPNEGPEDRILKAQKHRHGPGGAVKLKMDGETSRIWTPNRS